MGLKTRISLLQDTQDIEKMLKKLIKKLPWEIKYRVMYNIIAISLNMMKSEV